MPETVIFEDDTQRIIETTSDIDPDEPGGWRSTHVEWKIPPPLTDADRVAALEAQVETLLTALAKATTTANVRSAAVAAQQASG